MNLEGISYSLFGLSASEKIIFSNTIYWQESQTCVFDMRFTILQYSNQFAFGGWSWIVLTYRVQRDVITSDLGRSYLLPTRTDIRTETGER